jgi:hypothetical protein
MKTSFKFRAAAFVAAVLVTFGAVKSMADYAYPAAPAMQMALSSTSASH